MRKVSIPRIVMAGAAFLLLAAPVSGMADSLGKTFECPKTEATFFPPGNRVEIDDIILSTTEAAVVTVKFSPGNQRVVKVAMGANDTVVINYTGKVESLEEQSVRIDCQGTGSLFVTLVGSVAF